jgi:hypothetical protein
MKGWANVSERRDVGGGCETRTEERRAAKLSHQALLPPYAFAITCFLQIQIRAADLLWSPISLTFRHQSSNCNGRQVDPGDWHSQPDRPAPLALAVPTPFVQRHRLLGPSGEVSFGSPMATASSAMAEAATMVKKALQIFILGSRGGPISRSC